ncbi:putative competence-damage inducible protein [Planctomycetes bacterium CA13]|uniref:Putative competence-damage inducible protein n=1 Tax=Novipirellula herctigrandis TaxID=2527986 RepID=A0A5C5YYA0_9BACT|nr:putative competence-damage inducible protein [Planctomycetes bacterium CA13]
MSDTSNPDNAVKRVAEVISIGDEMTSGARLDTNSQWLSQRLGELGIEVAFHTTVADTLANNIDVFRTAARRVDLVVCTGGLGPTRDDLTREALAEAAGEPLEFRQQAMDHIESIFQNRKRPMSERNRLQAMFPRSSQMIPNPDGTAPGIDITIHPSVASEGDNLGDLSRHPCRVFSLPGVPAEMKPMFDASVAPAIMDMVGGGQVIRSLVMKFFGTGESDMESRLGEMISRDRMPRVGITVSAATISLRITAAGQSVDQCDSMLVDTKAEILTRVSDLYYGDGEQFEQYHAIDSMLQARKESLMVVELGYAAPLGDWFASLGETPAYRGGLSLATKTDLQEIAGADSFDEAILDFKSRFGADWLLLVSEYPQIRDDQIVGQKGCGLPMADVTLLVVSPDGRSQISATGVGGHPKILQSRIGKYAMQFLRRVVGEYRPVPID